MTKGKAKKQASVYSVKELAAGSTEIFGVSPECVFAAMKLAGKHEAAVEEAAAIINNFMKKEVI